MPEKQIGIEQIPFTAGLDADANFTADLNQPFRGQHFNRLAGRGAAHLEVARQRALGIQKSDMAVYFRAQNLNRNLLGQRVM